MNPCTEVVKKSKVIKTSSVTPDNKSELVFKKLETKIATLFEYLDLHFMDYLVFTPVTERDIHRFVDGTLRAWLEIIL